MKDIVQSRLLEFAEGSVKVYSDGRARFHFRNMDYVYKEGSDSDGMSIDLESAVVEAIEAFLSGGIP